MNKTVFLIRNVDPDSYGGAESYQLELAGKRGDDKFIRANHHDFLDEYKELISTITKAIIEFNRPNG